MINRSNVDRQFQRCGECGHILAMHRIGDDACPIVDEDDLSFHPAKKFVPEQPAVEGEGIAP